VRVTKGVLAGGALAGGVLPSIPPSVLGDPWGVHISRPCQGP